MDINIDQGCGWAMDPGMTPSSSSGLDETMALGGSLGYSDLYGPSRDSTLRL